MLLSRLIVAGLFCLAALPAWASDAQLPARTQPAQVISAAATTAPLLAVQNAPATPAQPVAGPHSSMWEVCSTLAAAPDDSQDSTYRWRMEAFRQLECVVKAVEHALEGVHGEDGTVTLTRADLEEFRTRALWAKDAAARIGR